MASLPEASLACSVATKLSTVRLKVVKRIVRCAATEVNPETAARDANPPRDLRRHFGG